MVVGCADNAKVLDRVERVIVEQPDSALSILNGIDTRTLISRRNRAKYALLLSQALDKNYIDKTDFEILQPAIDYYENHGTTAERFLTLYYQGRILSNSEDYVQAILSYTKAEELVPQISDNYSIGLLYAQMGSIYEVLYDYPKALTAREKSYLYYQSANKTTLQFYAKLHIGELYMQKGEYAIAVQNLTEVLKWGYDNQKISLCRACFGLLSQLYEAMGDYDSLRQLTESEYADLLIDELVVLRSKAYLAALQQNEDKVRTYLDSAWERAKSQQDSINLLIKEYQTNKKLGQYRQALEYYEELFRIEDSIVRHTLQQPVISAQKDYFQSQAEYHKLKLQHNRLVLFVIVVVVLLFVAGILFFVRQRIVVKNNEIQHYMEVAHNLEQELFVKTKDAKDMGIEIAQMNERINRLFVAQFDTLDKLSNTYYEMHHTQRVKEAIYTAVKKEIDIFSSKESVYHLEDIVNTHRNNIMKKIRSTLPQFGEVDFRLLCFIFAGFSAKAISIFTGNSVGNIYMKKSRLKSKILSSDSPYKEEIIKLLS